MTTYQYISPSRAKALYPGNNIPLAQLEAILASANSTYDTFNSEWGKTANLAYFNTVFSPWLEQLQSAGYYYLNSSNTSTTVRHLVPSGSMLNFVGNGLTGYVQDDGGKGYIQVGAGGSVFVWNNVTYGTHTNISGANSFMSSYNGNAYVRLMANNDGINFFGQNNIARVSSNDGVYDYSGGATVNIDSNATASVMEIAVNQTLYANLNGNYATLNAIDYYGNGREMVNILGNNNTANLSNALSTVNITGNLNIVNGGGMESTITINASGLTSTVINSSVFGIYLPKANDNVTINGNANGVHIADSSDSVTITGHNNYVMFTGSYISNNGGWRGADLTIYGAVNTLYADSHNTAVAGYVFNNGPFTLGNFQTSGNIRAHLEWTNSNGPLMWKIDSISGNPVNVPSSSAATQLVSAMAASSSPSSAALSLAANPISGPSNTLIASQY